MKRRMSATVCVRLNCTFCMASRTLTKPCTDALGWGSKSPTLLTPTKLAHRLCQYTAEADSEMLNRPHQQSRPDPSGKFWGKGVRGLGVPGGSHRPGRP